MLRLHTINVKFHTMSEIMFVDGIVPAICSSLLNRTSLQTGSLHFLASLPLCSYLSFCAET